MPLMLKKKGKVLPIGVDLGSSSLKMAQLRISQDEEIELLAAGASDVPAPLRQDFHGRLPFITQAIRTNLKANEFKSRQGILSLPACHTFLQSVKMPRLAPPEMDKALRMELNGKLPCPVDQAVIRYVVAGDIYGDGDGRQEVIVAAADRNILDLYLDAATKGGLDVVGVDIEAAAVIECFARLFRRAADAQRTIMFLDLGALSTQAVMTHGEQLVFARNLGIAQQQFDEALAAGMSIPVDQAHSLHWDLLKAEKGSEAEDELYRHMEGPLEQLAGEITQCLRYYESVFRTTPVERVIFVGGQAYDKRLCQSLAQRLNLPAQIGDPLVRVRRMAGAGMQIGLDRREPQPNWAVAVGLSLGATKAA